MLSFDATFVWILLSFVIFMLLMKGLYFDPVQKIKLTREQQKEQDAAKRRELLAAASDLEVTYESGLEEARQKAQQLIQEHRQQALKRAGETIAQTRAGAVEKLSAELDALAKERDTLYQQLLPEKEALAQMIVQKVTSTKVPSTL